MDELWTSSCGSPPAVCCLQAKGLTYIVAQVRANTAAEAPQNPIRPPSQLAHLITSDL